MARRTTKKASIKKASRSTSRRHTNQLVSETLIVRAARLLHEERKSQKEIATELGVSPTTVSRLIEAAELADIIHVEIRPPRPLDLETRLTECLKKRGIDNVVVAHHRSATGDEKNTHNLGRAGARFLMSAIEEVGKSTVAVSIACGETLRAVLNEFIRLADHPPVPTKMLEALAFYPTTLHSGYHLRAIYPATLVSSLSMVRFGTFKVDLYATNLPDGFHDLPTEKRSDYLRRWRADELLDRASKADVFLLGIGTTDTEPYREIVGTLKIEDWENEKGRFVAEVAYTPIDAEGQVADRVAKKVVGVSLDRLRNAARTKGTYVIGVAGGAAKHRAVEAAIKGGYFNSLVTDEEVAEHLLGVFA